MGELERNRQDTACLPACLPAGFPWGAERKTRPTTNAAPERFCLCPWPSSSARLVSLAGPPSGPFHSTEGPRSPGRALWLSKTFDAGPPPGRPVSHSRAEAEASASSFQPQAEILRQGKTETLNQVTFQRPPKGGGGHLGEHSPTEKTESLGETTPLGGVEPRRGRGRPSRRGGSEAVCSLSTPVCRGAPSSLVPRASLLSSCANPALPAGADTKGGGRKAPEGTLQADWEGGSPWHGRQWPAGASIMCRELRREGVGSPPSWSERGPPQPVAGSEPAGEGCSGFSSPGLASCLWALPSFSPEEPDSLAEKEGQQNVLTQIQGKYAYFRPTIQVELEHEDPKTAREIFIRSWRLEEKMLGVLAKCLPALSNLQAVRLWKVGLTDASLLSLITILPTCPNLKALSLEGNPLPERSFHKLIGEDSTLVSVSLRNDDIDDEAAALIGQALSSLRSSNKTLASINLSYNWITDIGAASLANGLRLNRSLLSLSLSHNHIGDEGAMKLAEVLAPFALTHTEVVERRRLLVEKEYQERCRMPQRHSEVKTDRPSSHLSNTTLEKLQPAKASKVTTKKKEPGKKEEKGQGSVGGAATQAGGSAQAKKEEVKQAKKAPPAPEQKAPRGKGAKSGTKDKRSQVLEVEATEPTEMVNPLLEQAEHRDGKVFLPGNRVLIYLNLIRNQITERGLKAFLTSVEQQAFKGPTPGKGPTGLLRLSLGKNDFPLESKTFARIQELMTPRDPLPRTSKAAEEDQPFIY